MRRLLSLLAVLVLVAWAAPRAALADIVGGEVLSVGLGSARGHGTYRQGHWVPVHVRLENRSGSQFDGYLAAEENDLDGDKVVSISRGFSLNASMEPRDLWLYYWPRPDDDQKGVKSVQVLDQNKRTIATLKSELVPDTLARQPGILPEHGEDSHSQRWVLVLGRRPMGLEWYGGAKGGVATIRYDQLLTATDIPDRALGLDGVDTIIWEADSEGFRTSEVPADHQLNAIQEWVRAGGHLIVTTGGEWRQTFDPSLKLAEMLPLAIDLKQAQQGDRQAPDSDLLKNWIGPVFIPRDPSATPPVERVEVFPHIPGPFTQVVGHLKPGARVIAPATAVAGIPPLVVTGRYGAGAVTLITIDMTARPLQGEGGLTAREWLAFWQKAAGWSGGMLAYADYDAYNRNLSKPGADDDHIVENPTSARLDTGVASSIDFTRQTSIRLLLAVLFLGGYWLAAGPGSHMVLRYYHVPHWSWWIFGAMVLAASGAAVLIVSALRLENRDVKHRTYVMGEVNESDISIVGYYGVYAPVDGSVDLKLPATTGLAYLTPFNEPRYEAVAGYVDPQRYTIDDEQPGSIRVPFRNTLKKMQGRWVGSLGGPATWGITSTGLRATMTRPPGAVMNLEGQLVNHTPYDLHDVQIVALVDGNPRSVVSPDSIFDAGYWKSGDTLDLGKQATRRRESLWDNLASIGKRYGESGKFATHIGVSGGMTEEETKLAGQEKYQQDLLNILLDLRPPAGTDSWKVAGLLRSTPRVEFMRHFTRLIDRSKSLRAGGLLIIARAGDEDHGVPSPIPINVNGIDIPGTGEILFTWSAVLDK